MSKDKIVMIHERLPSLKEQRKQRANRRLLFFLSFFFILLLLMIYFQSPLSYVKNVTVNGNHFIEDEELVELSQISDQTSMWNIDKEEVKQRLLKHWEVSAVTIERKFPNTIELFIEEHVRIGYLFRSDRYYPILETGQYLSELPRHEFPADAPILLNFDQGDTLAELSAELRKVPSHLIERISEIFHEPTNSDPLSIILYMTDGIEVHTSIRGFSEKMESYPSIAKELDHSKQGILHMKMSSYFEDFNIEEEDDIEGEG